MKSEDRPLGVDEVVPLAKALAEADDTFIVGGQAVNLWSWFYRDKDQRLKDAEPFTSQDVDYFGMPAAAKRFAQIMGVKPIMASPDDNTVNTAIVWVQVNGRMVRVDFLHQILGIKNKELRAGVSEILISLGGDQEPLQIRVLHPILCVKSRIANMLHPATGRRDEIAFKQLHASLIVAKLYIDDALADGDVKEAQRCLVTLLEYLEYDQFGSIAHLRLGADILEIVSPFIGEDRLDHRFRSHQIGGGISRVCADRDRRLRRR